MSLDINHKEQTSISILSKQQEMIQIFKKHYDFLEKLANYSLGKTFPLIYNYGYVNSVKSTREIKREKIIKNKR